MRTDTPFQPAISAFAARLDVARMTLSLAVLLLMGCGTRPDDAKHQAATVLRVAAASDLQGVLPAIAGRFTAATGITVTPVFGASGQLAHQVRQGAPFDVFLSANIAYVRDLADAGQVRADSVCGVCAGAACAGRQRVMRRGRRRPR